MKTKIERWEDYRWWIYHRLKKSKQDQPKNVLSKQIGVAAKKKFNENKHQLRFIIAGKSIHKIDSYIRADYVHSQSTLCLLFSSLNRQRRFFSFHLREEKKRACNRLYLLNRFTSRSIDIQMWIRLPFNKKQSSALSMTTIRQMFKINAESVLTLS